MLFLFNNQITTIIDIKKICQNVFYFDQVAIKYIAIPSERKLIHTDKVYKKDYRVKF